MFTARILKDIAMDKEKQIVSMSKALDAIHAESLNLLRKIKPDDKDIYERVESIASLSRYKFEVINTKEKDD